MVDQSTSQNLRRPSPLAVARTAPSGERERSWIVLGRGREGWGEMEGEERGERGCGEVGGEERRGVG